LGKYDPVAFTTKKTHHSAPSDLAPMLDLLPAYNRFKPTECEVTQVYQGEKFASGNDDSAVLLIGDSYSYIFNGRDPDDAAGADLGRQIMLRLATPVQVNAEKDRDPTMGRWDAVANHTNALLAKKVVIWEFTTRFLQDMNKWNKGNPVGFPPLEQFRGGR
jgi:hypothetical protein